MNKYSESEGLTTYDALRITKLKDLAALKAVLQKPLAQTEHGKRLLNDRDVSMRHRTTTGYVGYKVRRLLTMFDGRYFIFKIKRIFLAYLKYNEMR